MTYLADLVDLVLPRRCVGCTAVGELLCQACRPSASERLTAGPLPVSAAGCYVDGVRDAVLRYKERGRRDLAGPLADLLVVAVMDLLEQVGRSPGPPVLVLVPVPSARRAVAERGGDHLLRLARRVGAACGIPVVPSLRLVRSVRDSAGLGAADRAANLVGAMAARPPTARSTAIVVDDVMTTGSTLREAHRALASAGWTVLGAGVVAATPLRHEATPLRHRCDTAATPLRHRCDRPGPLGISRADPLASLRSGG